MMLHPRRNPILLFLAIAFLLGVTPAAAEMQERFGILFDGYIQDGGFNEGGLAGANRARAEYGLVYRRLAVSDQEEARQAIRKFARVGINNIIVLGFRNAAVVDQVAEAYPAIRFTVIDAVSQRSNVRSVLFRDDQAGYLAGVAAALHSETGKLGFIGAIPIPPIVGFGCGFVQGARSVDPEVAVSWRYIGSDGGAFRDRSGAKTLARAMIAQGVDVVFPAAGFAGIGALEAAYEAGAHGIGVDVNQNGLFPGSVLTSAVKRVDQAVYLAWRSVVEGTWSPTIQRLGLENRGIDWVVDEHNRSLIAGIRDRVEAAKSAMMRGEIAIAPAESVAGCKTGATEIR